MSTFSWTKEDLNKHQILEADKYLEFFKTRENIARAHGYKFEGFTKHCVIYKKGNIGIMVGLEPNVGWHLSISHPHRYPTWDEIRNARFVMTPNEVTMAFILPPSSEYVNIHPNCFHLFEIKENVSKIIQPI